MPVAAGVRLSDWPATLTAMSSGTALVPPGAPVGLRHGEAYADEQRYQSTFLVERTEEGDAEIAELWFP